MVVVDTVEYSKCFLQCSDDAICDPVAHFLQVSYRYVPVATGPVFVICTHSDQKSRFVGDQNTR